MSEFIVLQSRIALLQLCVWVGSTHLSFDVKGSVGGVALDIQQDKVLEVRGVPHWSNKVLRVVVPNPKRAAACRIFTYDRNVSTYMQ